MYLGKLGPVNVCCGAYPGHRDHCPGRTPEPAAASGTSGGRVVARPLPKHDCAPGWTAKTGSDGKGRVLDPPSATDYPKGTVWECPCGKTWVSRGSAGTYSNMAHWHREGRPARWWRTRKASARSQDRI